MKFISSDWERLMRAPRERIFVLGMRRDERGHFDGLLWCMIMPCMNSMSAWESRERGGWMAGGFCWGAGGAGLDDTGESVAGEPVVC